MIVKNYKYILKSNQLTKLDSQMSKMVWLNTKFSIWNPNEGIDIFGFKLRYYGLMFVFAFGFGILIMRQIFKIDNVDDKFIDPLFTWTLLGTIFGARIGHVVFYEPSLFVTDFWSVFLPIRTKPTLEFTGFSGLASHGATIALIFTTLYYSFRIIKKNPFQTPPPYEILIGDLKGYYSRRINKQHRLVYEVIEEKKRINIISMWKYYEF